MDGRFFDGTINGTLPQFGRLFTFACTENMQIGNAWAFSGDHDRKNSRCKHFAAAFASLLCCARRDAALARLTRPTMYSFPTGQYPYPMLSPEMSAQVATWTLRRDIGSIFKAYAEHVPDTGSGEFSKSLSERFARPSGLLSPFLTIQPNPVTSRTRSSSHTPRIPPCHSNTWAQTGIT
ncbi:hypothetical protein HUJ05_004529 [Dendroctonus ponderosae]|nr:hypothetical protein HUJ05_004529 [Dendroctonus ponderosae]